MTDTAPLLTARTKAAPVALGAVLLLWAVVAVVLPYRDAGDAVAMVMAHDLVLERGPDLYPTDGRIAHVTREFGTRSCADPDINPECRPVSGFVSPPPAYPLVWVIGALPGSLPIRVWMVLSTVAVIAAFVLLAGRRFFVERPWLLVLSAVALTPFMVALPRQGQSTGLLVFALVAAGSRRSLAIVAGVALGAVAVLKVTPLIPLAASFFCRRRRAAIAATATVAVLAVVGTAMWPGGWSAFLTLSRAMSDVSPLTAGNGSLAAAVGGGVAVTALGLLLAAAAAWLVRQDRERVWLIAANASLLAAPLLWPHYVVVSVVSLLLLAAHLRAAWPVGVAAVLALALGVAPLADLNNAPWAFAVLATVAATALAPGRHAATAGARAPVAGSR